MIKMTFVCVCGLLLLAAPAWPQAEKPVIAVGNLRNAAGIDPKIVEALDDMFITALQKTGKFKIVERKQLADIEKEQDLAEALKIGQTEMSLAQVNKLTGAQYYVLGSVSAFVDRVKESIYESMGVATTQHVSSVALDVRVSDTTTGQVMEAVTVTKERKEMDAGTTTIVGEPNLNNGQLADVVREAVNAAAVEVVDAIFPIKVMEIEENLLFLNRGSGGGIEIGQVVEIFAPGKPLKDPDSGEVIGSSERKVGAAQVTEVLPRFSKAAILENGGIEVGQLARKQIRQ